MLKTVITALTALMIVAPAIAQAEQEKGAAASQRMSASDWNALTDTRIGVVKAALQLKPDQMKYWQPIEDAIRARATGRQHRMAELRSAMSDDKEPNPVELLQIRANNLAQRSDELKKLAEAWQPLYPTLDADQKRRLRFVAIHVLNEIRDVEEDEEMQND
jgi:hypothetical protein